MYTKSKVTFYLFTAIRVFYAITDTLQAYFLMQVINWINDDTTYDQDKALYALMCALAIPMMQIFHHVTIEFMIFYVIECGHRIHTSLKTILFAKTMRMSNSTNKDFDSSEIESIIMRDTDIIWGILWQCPDFIEEPFRLIVSCYMTFQYIGWYGGIVVATTFIKFGTSWIRNYT